MSKWTDFVKDYASKKGITYRQALKDKECAETYHSSKGKGLEEVKEEPKEEIKEEVKEEPKEVEKPKQKRKPRAKKSVPSLEGEGLIAKSTAEAINGLEHIYPLSHEHIVKMLETCV